MLRGLLPGELLALQVPVKLDPSASPHCTGGQTSRLDPRGCWPEPGGAGAAAGALGFGGLRAPLCFTLALEQGSSEV